MWSKILLLLVNLPGMIKNLEKIFAKCKDVFDRLYALYGAWKEKRRQQKRAKELNDAEREKNKHKKAKKFMDFINRNRN